MLKQDFIGSVQRCTLSNENSFLRFLPEYGATPTELCLSLHGKQYEIFDGFQTEAQIQENEKSRGIFLIPFPNRIRDGKYAFEGAEYQLPINKPKENNAIHGFIWNRVFQIAEEKNAVKLTHDYKGDFPGFPFPFSASIRFALSESACAVEVTVLNTGNTSLPLGIGWHPYFTFKTQVDDLRLQLPSCRHLFTDERLIPTGNRNPYTDFETARTIGKKDFDDAFECTGAHDFFETRLTKVQSGITIILQQDSTFKYLQVYTPPGRESIALEPMTCPANAFNSGEGLIALPSGKSYSGKIRISIALDS